MTLAPVQPRTALIYPFLGSGRTKGGIYVDFHHTLPPILGRVLRRHPTCNYINDGDVVVFRPHHYDSANSSLGEIRVIHEDNVQGIIDGYGEHNPT